MRWVWSLGIVAAAAALTAVLAVDPVARTAAVVAVVVVGLIVLLAVIRHRRTVGEMRDTLNEVTADTERERSSP